MPGVSVYKRSCLPLGLALLVLCSGLYYARLLFAFFTGADTIFQIDTSRFSTFPEMVRVLTQPTMGNNITIGGGIFYRPLTSLQYGIYYAVWGTDPLGYHLSDLILHLAVVLLVFWLGRLIFRSYAAAILSALFFSLHPVVTSALIEPGGAGDIPMTLFFVLTAITFLLYQRSGRRLYLAISLASYLLSLMSKESAMMMWLVILAAILISAGGSQSARHRIRQSLQQVAPFTGLAVAFFFVRLFVLRGLGGYPAESNDPLTILRISGQHLTDYFVDLVSDRTLLGDAATFSELLFISLAVLAVSVLGLSALWGVRRIERLSRMRFTVEAVALAGAAALAGVAVTLPAKTASELLTNVFFSLLLASFYSLALGTVGGNWGFTRLIRRPGNAPWIMVLFLWLYLPLALSQITRTFADYNMYLPAVAFCMLLGYALATGGRKLISEGRALASSREEGTDALKLALAGLTFAVIIFSIASINELQGLKGERPDQVFLKKIASLESKLPDGGSIYIYDFPEEIFPFDGPQQHLLDTYELQAWARISAPDKDVQVNIESYKGGPVKRENLSFDTVWQGESEVALTVRIK